MRRAAALGALVALTVTGCGNGGGGGEPGGSTSAPAPSSTSPSPTKPSETSDPSQRSATGDPGDPTGSASTPPRRAGTAPGSQVARQLEAHLRKTAPGSRADTLRCTPIPRYVGADSGCSATVDGERVSYEARVVSVDGDRVSVTFQRIGAPSASIPVRPTT
ncbi:hypothetical protein FB554_1632 [Barrientosiimonas humi]|uniref:DUF4333 domain-containing protein n=1 Tax=Barrientosiimonas humi TaxID=999931 RepID=A0A542XCJ7_9MICO|nr:hypothetical protein [Barrientosiimonas humi]TQL33486.1 hypothetical protein FB554_1632 [Barrientosiimonas humi]CAG7573474.1 hypothetical protein BH39T_PBIAJDOK_02107 [Barrientosiimonas humi]